MDGIEQILTLDFETLFGVPHAVHKTYSLSNMTNEAYIRDPLFEIQLVGIKVDEGKSWALLPERGEQFLREEVDWEHTAMLSCHAQFDAAILYWKYGISPSFLLDTIPMAAIVDGPKAGLSLEQCLTRHNLGVKNINTLLQTRGKRLADFTAGELRAFMTYCEEDCDNEYKLLQFYLPQCTEQQLKLIDLKTRMFTEPVFQGDVDLLAEAVVSEQQRKEALLAHCGYDKKVFSSSDKFAEILRAHGREAPTKISSTPNKDGTAKTIFAFAKTDPGMQELLEDQDEDIRFLAETRLSVKSTIIETRAQRFLDCARRGPLPVYIKSNGTHTQRASAGDGMNWMNLTSVNKANPMMTVIKRAIRAPAGCKIVSADSSQIQARLTSWMAGQQDKLEAFAQGRDVYSEFATRIYGRHVDRKANPVDDFIPGQVGKISELSFMFQQGWTTAATNFLKGHLGAPPIQFTQKDMEAMHIDPTRFLNNPKNVEIVSAMPSRLELGDRLIHCAVSNGIVQMWRQANPMIAGKDGLWATMEGVINAMIRGERVHFGPRGVLYTEKECIVAPSGARLNYPGLQRSDKGEATYWDGRARVHIYGGSATNNTIQLLEQEIVGAQMIAIHQAGYKVATECYDNIVCVVPEEYAEQCRQFMEAMMTTHPEWGQDIPLAADSGVGDTWYEAK